MAIWSIMRSSYVNLFILHNKLFQVAIWLGPWTISLSKVLTMWQTSVCWSMIYLCEVVSQGVQSFGSTVCTRTWYPSFYEELLLVLIKIWNRCWRNFERVSVSRFYVHLWPMGAIPLHLEHRFHWEIVFVSSKIVSVCSRNTHFGKSEGIMLQWRIWFFQISHILSVSLLYLFCFSLGLLLSLTTYAICRAPCAIVANQKQ